MREVEKMLCVVVRGEQIETFFGHKHHWDVWQKKRKKKNAYGKSSGFSVKHGGRSLMLRSCFAAGGPMALVNQDSVKYQDISVQNDPGSFDSR